MISHSALIPAREALEAFAIAGYRSGALTPRQIRDFKTWRIYVQLAANDATGNIYGAGGGGGQP